MHRISKYNFKGISIKSILIILLGNLSLVIGINLFMVPSNLIPTGLSGFSYELAVIFRHLFTGTPINTLLNSSDINYGLIFFLLNIPIIFFGLYKIGKRFVGKTLISVVAFSIISILVPVQSIIPIVSTGDQFVAAIVGAIFIGLGTGLLLRVGGSSGGTDIIAVFISLYKGKSFGLYNFLINSIVILIGMILYNDIAVGVIVLLHLYILNIVIDKVHNNHEKKLLIIFTKKPDDIIDAMKDNLYRGITILDSRGGHSKVEISTLMISISRDQVHPVTKIIREVDKNSFINVLKVESIVGYFIDTYKETL